MNSNPEFLDLKKGNTLKNTTANYASASIVVLKSDENISRKDIEPENNLINIESLAAEVDQLTYIEEEKEQYIEDEPEEIKKPFPVKKKLLSKKVKRKSIPEKVNMIEEMAVSAEPLPEAATKLEDENAIPAETEIQEPAAETKENIFTIEIPDNIFNSLPRNFDIHELGKVDLREAENIASEDILSLVKDDLRDELEELNLIPGGKAEHTPFKKLQEPDDEKSSAAIQKVPAEKIQETTNIITRATEPEAKSGSNAAEKTEKKTGLKAEEPIKEDKKEKHDKNAVSDTAQTRTEPKIKDKTKEIKAKKGTDDKTQPESISPDSALIIKQDENTSNMTQKSGSRQAEILEKISDKLEINNHENPDVYMIDDEFVEKDKTPGKMLKSNELEKDISAIDMIRGEVKQLEESAAEEKNDIIGILGDKPTFEDLLYDTKDTHRFIDDEIDFIDESFMAEGFKDYLSAERDSLAESEDKISIESTKSGIFGLIPEEVELIEEKIIGNGYTGSSDSIKTQTAGKTDSSGCRYLTASPDSLSAAVRHSIEKDLKASGALIIEEDVGKISEKIEVLMKKQIKDTIQDITDRITIFENESDFKKFIEKMPKAEKDNVKKLLNYLNDLLDKLPEQEIKNFANSEYYDLYTKLLRNMDK